MDELIEGAFAVLMGLVLVIAVPVFAIYFAVKGVVWLWVNYWYFVVGVPALVVVLTILAVAFKVWLDRSQVRRAQRRGLRYLDNSFKETWARMEDIARQHPAEEAPQPVVVKGQVVTPALENGGTS